MNKRLLFLITICSFLICNTNPIQATTVMPQKEPNINVSIDGNNDNNSEIEIIKRLSFREKFQKSPEAQITEFFNKYNKYSAKNNIAKLKEMFSDSYVNNDGFDKKTVFTLMELSSDIYQDLSYNTEIESIKVIGNYAVVKAHETASGKTNKKIEKIDDTGIITSNVYYTDYLQKESNKWKITATEITSEEIQLKYGEAKNMLIEMTAPECIAAGSEYEAKISAKVPDGAFVVGSIVNEPIVYPQVESKDVFRSVKSEELARILKANKNNHNEYATASMAITRAEIKPPEVLLNMTGIAFSMKRINVIPVKEYPQDKEN